MQIKNASATKKGPGRYHSQGYKRPTKKNNPAAWKGRK